ncbi:MAG TPA: hypothetical protein PLT68_11875 [Actinomycetota bacterium]|nr:hypothetical protein [Actinomycetota bacterium]
MSIKRWIPVVLATGVALAGCGPTLAGSAAVVGEERLTDAQLADATSRLAEGLGIPESAQVSQAILSRWVVAELVDELAQQRGVSVTKGAVDASIAKETERAGGAEALEQSALQAGVVPEMIPDVVRTTLLIQELSKVSVTPDDPSGQSGLLAQVQFVSDQLDPQISPRFGSWDAQQLSVGALPDDLSAPADATDALTQLQMQ